MERHAATFQDRLTAELHLAGARTLAQANRVLADCLPRFNTRFGVPPAEPGCAYRRVPADKDLAGVLCVKQTRKVGRDNTVNYRWQSLQLLPGRDRLSYAGVWVEVQEPLDGGLVVCHEGRILPTQEAPRRPAPWWRKHALAPTHVAPAEDPHAPAPVPRQPTPRQRMRWEAVQAAMARGLGGIAQELGIARNIVRRYAQAPQPTANRPRATKLASAPKH